MLKGYGHPVESDLEDPLELRELTVCTDDPAFVRALGEFLIGAAGEMDEAGRRFGHRHFRDARKDLWRPEFVDFIVEWMDRPGATSRTCDR